MVKLAQHDQEQLDKAKDLMDTGPLQDIGFVRSLFFGKLRLDKVLPYPTQSEEEMARTDTLLYDVGRFLDHEVDPDAIDRNERIPEAVLRGFGDLGVLGMTVPRTYGGGGFSHTAYCRVLQRVAQRCASCAVLVGAHQSIGLKALVLNGTEAQKARYLPDLAAGRKLAAFALTEPEAGSDAANVQTSARQSEDGRHWILNGDKRYITNGALAGVMTVMARTVVGQNGGAREKVSAFIVTPDMPGFEVVSSNSSKCGIRGTWQATLRFNDMHVPSDHVLGELGRGLKVALTVLDYGRCTLSAGCVGGARVALDMALEHVSRRRQFGRYLGDFELVRQQISRMAEMTFAMESLTYLCAGMVDRHDDDMMLETAACKLFCSEASWRVIDDAVQIHGGAGYMREHGLERMLRDARINRIVEGATEVMTSFVALMGMKGVGEQFEQTLQAVRHPINNLGNLASFARHEWQDIVVGARCVGLHSDIQKEGRMLAQLTRRLARDISRLLASHRQHILDRQLLQQRVAWSVIEMFAMAAVIGRLQRTLDGSEPVAPEVAQRDLVVGRAYCRHAAGRVSRRLRGLFRNRDRDRMDVATAVLGQGSEA